MTHSPYNQKLKPDVKDVLFIFQDFQRFNAMSIEDYNSHINLHPEDEHHQIDSPELRGRSQFISGNSSQRFRDLTNRLLISKNLEKIKYDFDLLELNQEIRNQFAIDFIRNEKPIKQQSVDRMLNKALKSSKEKHKVITHYLPCVAVRKTEPKEFNLGVVRFIRTDKFFEDYETKIKCDLDSQSQKQWDQAQERIVDAGHPMSLDDWNKIDQQTWDWIFEYYQQFHWIAEISVPIADPKVSRRRAELALQASLDFLKALYGQHNANNLRLGHKPDSPRKTADLIRTRTQTGFGEFEWRIAFSGGIQGLCIKDDWFNELRDKWGVYIDAAGQAIETYLKPNQPSELCERWLDALNWCGQAISSELPSDQILKYTAALERLTITQKTPQDSDKGLTDSVSRRAAFLATLGLTESFETACTDIRKIYGLRSNLLHGRSSPSPKNQSVEHQIERERNRADKLTCQALFGAIIVYTNLLENEKTKSEDLEEWFINQQSLDSSAGG